jgi:glycosyltransferase domain-containing protein
LNENLDLNLAIIIPTKDRIVWVNKVLQYYSDLDFTGHLVIINSSENNNFPNTDEIYPNLNLNIIYRADATVHEAISIGIESLPEKIKYVIQSGDDDFICVGSLAKMIDFLDVNPDFNAVYGDAYAIGFNKLTDNRFRSSWCSRYWRGYEIKSQNPLTRVSKLLEKYLNLEFAIRRKENVREGIKFINDFIGRKDFEESTTLETLASIDTVLAGNIFYLAEDYLIRGDHPGRPNRYGQSMIRQYVGTSKSFDFTSFLSNRLETKFELNPVDLEKQVNDIIMDYVEMSISKRIISTHKRRNMLDVINFLVRRVNGFYFKYKLRKYLALIHK